MSFGPDADSLMPYYKPHVFERAQMIHNDYTSFQIKCEVLTSCEVYETSFHPYGKECAEEEVSIIMATLGWVKHL